MFWSVRTYAQPTPVEAFLDKANTDLEELLQLDELLQVRDTSLLLTFPATVSHHAVTFFHHPTVPCLGVVSVSGLAFHPAVCCCKFFPFPHHACGSCLFVYCEVLLREKEQDSGQSVHGRLW